MKLFKTTLTLTALPMVAFAAEAATQAVEATKTYAIDLSGIATTAAPLLLIGLGVLLYKGIKYLTVKAGVEGLVKEDQIKSLVDKLIAEASKYAVSNLKKADWLKTSTKYEAVATATSYVQEHGDELLKKAGLDEQKLKQKIEAKLLDFDTHPGVWKN